MTNDQTHIIVGASLAGAKATDTLRHEGFIGRVVLVGTEDERPYERPPLSKDTCAERSGASRSTTDCCSPRAASSTAHCTYAASGSQTG